MRQNKHAKAIIKVLDSGKLPKHTLTLIAHLLQCDGKEITLEFYYSVTAKRLHWSLLTCSDKEGQVTVDCSLAFITSICFGRDPGNELYNQKAMREHLLKSLEDGKVTPFPSATQKPEESIMDILYVYCTCRLPCNGKKMIIMFRLLRMASHALLNQEYLNNSSYVKMRKSRPYLFTL